MLYLKKELGYHFFSVAFVVCVVLSIWMFRDQVIPEDWIDYAEPLDIESYVYLHMMEDYEHHTTKVMSGLSSYQSVALTQKTEKQIYDDLLLFNPMYEKQTRTERYQYRPHIGYQQFCKALDALQTVIRTEYDTHGGAYSVYIHEMDSAYYWHEEYCNEHYSPDQRVKRELAGLMAQDRIHLYDEFDDTIDLKAEQGIEKTFYDQTMKWKEMIRPHFLQMSAAESYSRSISRFFSAYLMVPLLFGVVLMSAFTFEADRRNHMEGFVYHSVMKSGTLVFVRILSVLCPVLLLLFGLVYSEAGYFNGIAEKMGYIINGRDYVATILIDMLPGILFMAAVSFLVDLVFSNGVITIVFGVIMLGIFVLNPAGEIDLWRVFYVYPAMNMTRQFEEHGKIFIGNRILITGLSGVLFCGTGILFERMRSGKTLFSDFGKWFLKNAIICKVYRALLRKSGRDECSGIFEKNIFTNRFSYCIQDCINTPVIIGLVLIPVAILFTLFSHGSYGDRNIYVTGFSLWIPLSAVFLFIGTSDTNIEYRYGMEEYILMQKKSNIISYLIRFLWVFWILACGCGIGLLVFVVSGRMQSVLGVGLIKVYFSGLTVACTVGIWCAVISVLVRSVHTDLLLGIGIFMEYLRLRQYIARKDFSAGGKLFELWLKKYFVPAYAIGAVVLFGVMIYKKYGKRRIN